MKKLSVLWFFALVTVGISFLGTVGSGRASHMGAHEGPGKKKDRPLYIYEGNYRDEINSLKDQFKQAYGYELMDLDTGWRPEEIRKLHQTFAQLPENFYRIGKLKGFYRASELTLPNSGSGAEELPDPSGIPAATFPRFMTVYRQTHQQYQVALTDEPLRIEFYNSMFYKGEDDFANIVHHEMGHIFDLSHGFLTFQDDWLNLAGFRILHLPALDGKPDSDFLFTLVNDPGIAHYSPVSQQHLPTYSRENPQEDFANSVAAYRHYPYFQYTHPRRYRFIREKVFQGKEYFPADTREYAVIILERFQKSLKENNWEEVIRVVREQSRFANNTIEAKMVEEFQKVMARGASPDSDEQLAKASCYLVHPRALEIRQELLAARRIQLGKVFREQRCQIISKKMFEGDQARWPLMQVRFYRENGQAIVQFLDPAALTAYARGYETRYQWKLNVTTPRLRVISAGEALEAGEPKGAFTLDLKKTAKGRYKFPVNREVVLEVRAVRSHAHQSQPLESEWARLRLVVQPEFEYLGPKGASFHILYPPSWAVQP